MLKNKDRIPLFMGILFLLNVAASVTAAWTAGRHRYDLGISFSAYVGMYRPMSVVWFISAAVMTVLLSYYVAKTKMPRAKKAVYAVMFLCIFGTAFFPFNTFSDAPTAVTIDLHNYFAIALMLFTTVCFVTTLITAKDKRQRICAALSVLYAAAFIVLYFMGLPALFKVFFICENMFILLLLLSLYTERYGEEAG